MRGQRPDGVTAVKMTSHPPQRHHLTTSGGKDLREERSRDRLRSGWRVRGHVRSNSAVDQGMDEAVPAAPYLPGPGELLDVGTDQCAATQSDRHGVQIGFPVEVTGFLPAAQAVHGGVQGQLRTGTMLAVESLVAAQQ